jgi:succinyl-CoA:acetate CoA-transferase
VGSVGNAVLESLSGSGFRGLTMYTEVMQDAALKLLESGVLRFASASAVSLEEDSRSIFMSISTSSRQDNHPAPGDIQ